MTTKLPWELVDHGQLAATIGCFASLSDSQPPSVTRLCYTPTEQRARHELVARMSALGLTTRVDPAGNVIGRLEGSDASLPAVATGSHFDSVPDGGRYDGMAGVAAALEVARCMMLSNSRPRRSLEFLAFAAEESGRFPVAAHRLGSRAMAGQLGDLDPNTPRDEDGISLAEALKSCDLDPTRLRDAMRPRGSIQSFLELHIEQGATLARERASVAAVSAIVGSTRLQVTIEGRADHSGGTPMSERKDALACASEIVLVVEDTARTLGGSLVATVGALDVQPNAISVVPGHCVLGIDIRDTDVARKKEAMSRILKAISERAHDRSLTYEVLVGRDEDPISLPTALQRIVEDAARALGLKHLNVESRTGHDAASLSRICDSGMIFVRNTRGRSHCPDEDISINDLADGARVLAKAMNVLAES